MIETNAPLRWREHLTSQELTFKRCESQTPSTFLFLHKNWLIEVAKSATQGAWRLREMPPDNGGKKE